MTSSPRKRRRKDIIVVGSSQPVASSAAHTRKEPQKTRSGLVTSHSTTPTAIRESTNADVDDLNLPSTRILPDDLKNPGHEVIEWNIDDIVIDSNQLQTDLPFDTIPECSEILGLQSDDVRSSTDDCNSEKDDYAVGDISVLLEENILEMRDQTEVAHEPTVLRPEIAPLVDVEQQSRMNSVFHRHYGVHVFSTPSPTESIQIHIVKDFKLGHGEITILKNKFVIVTVLRIINNDRPALVCSCSACDSKSRFAFYYLQRNNATVFDISAVDLLPCNHLYPVLSILKYELKIYIHPAATNYKDLLYKELCAALIDQPTDLVPGSWYKDEDIVWRTEKGKLSIYFTECLQLLCVSQQKTSNGRRILHCYECPRSSGCNHTMLIPKDAAHDLGDLPDINDLLDADLNEADSANSHGIVSRLKYPFKLTEDARLIEVLDSRHRSGTRAWLDSIGGELVAETSECCGQACTKAPAKSNSKRCALFSLNGFVPAVVMNTRCSVCLKLFQFDGRRSGIVNFGNAKLFCVELFMELLEFKLNGGVPTHTYWKSKLNLISLVGANYSDIAMLKKEWMGLTGKLNEMMTSFLRLIDYGPSIFQCCPNPKAICVDGIVLSVESSRIESRQLKEPWIDPGVNSKRFSNRASRSIIVFAETDKDIVRRFINDGIEEDELLVLQDKYPGSIVVNVMGLTAIRTAEKIRCEPLLCDFFHCLYKDISPCISYAPMAVWETMEDLLQTRIPDNNVVTLLNEYAPVLSKVCLYLVKNQQPGSTGQDEIRTAIFQLLTDILETAKSSFIPPIGYQACIKPLEDILPSHDSYQELMDTGVFFPGRPIIRTVKRLKLSKEPKKCNKDHKKAGKLGAGTLLFWCAKHRCCLGFVVLKSAESLTQVFETFVTRFSVMPKVIIYDNGCNFHEYVLNRDPRLFKNTLILSDGFHWKNHTSCCLSYNSKAYPFLKRIASVLHEQKNVTLDKLKTTSVFMKYTSFCDLIIFVLHSMNTLELDRK